MDKEFIPYEQALALKELGFDEPCLAWHNSKRLFIDTYNSINSEMGFNYCCVLPTFSQAFRWFREKYDLYHNIDKHGYWFFEIKKDEGYGDLTVVDCCFDFESYEEAELACLDKLIELVESKNK